MLQLTPAMVCNTRPLCAIGINYHPPKKALLIGAIFVLLGFMGAGLAKPCYSEPVATNTPVLSAPIASSTSSEKPIALASITQKDFLAYKNVNDFIAQSPIVATITPPELRDIAQHGSEVVKVIQGADCNRDGQIDTQKQCIAAFYHLWLKFNR